MTAPSQTPLQQQTYDVIILGSGAGGLATAAAAAQQGLSVLVLEKAPCLGGTSAWSGGWMWVPRNPLAQAAGIQEPLEAPLRYLEELMGQPVTDERILAYLEQCPEAVAFFKDTLGIQFMDGNAVPDFHNLPHGVKGGRSVCAAAFDGKQLGDWLHCLRPPLAPMSLWGMGIASGADLKHFFNGTRKLSSAVHVLKRVSRHLWDLVRYGRATQLVNGNSLVAQLLKACVDRGVELKTSAQVQRLTQQDERVSGVEVCVGSQSHTLFARCGVVLATGGFPHDKARQQQLFNASHGLQHFSAAPKTNTGDGMTLGETVGGQVANDLAQPGAWSPVSLVPNGQGEFDHFPHLIERAKPGIIAVLPNGQRFTNEADSYHDFMQALFDATPKGQEPYCWLLADHTAQRRWGLGAAKPMPFSLTPYLRSGYLKKGDTLAALATECDLPVPALEQTVARFNQQACAGHDPDFLRGVSPYNQVQGDGEHQPNPALGELSNGPFYAVKVVAGSLGTFAGLKTNAQAQVLNAKGEPIAGLFAAGNDISSIFNGYYPSGGITLGPALTFGYIAAAQLAQ